MIFASLVLPALGNANNENVPLDYSLVGTWISAIAGVFAVVWGVYVYFRSHNNAVKKNSIDVNNYGSGKVEMTVKQKINEKSK